MMPWAWWWGAGQEPGADKPAVETAQEWCKCHPRNAAWCWECVVIEMVSGVFHGRHSGFCV